MTNSFNGSNAPHEMQIKLQIKSKLQIKLQIKNNLQIKLQYQYNSVKVLFI